jgi:hypothetical protein
MALRHLNYQANTDFDCVSIIPDLTRMQRQKESGMNEEAARRNEEKLPEDDCKTLVSERGRPERENVQRILQESAGENKLERGRWPAGGPTGTRPRAGSPKPTVKF